MKKIVILSILGLTAAAVSSYGQGSVAFNTYTANNSNGIPVTYGNGPSVGTGIGSTFTGELLWSSTSISDVASTALTAFNPITAGWTVGSTALFDTGQANGAAGLGFITGPNLVIPGNVSGTYYFEVVAFNGASYGAGTYAGHSATFTATLATGTTLPDPSQMNNLAPFSVYTSVPEPTTLALAGLGGLASLVAIRRKQA